jgi:hypothetical protein
MTGSPINQNKMKRKKCVVCGGTLPPSRLKYCSDVCMNFVHDGSMAEGYDISFFKKQSRIMDRDNHQCKLAGVDDGDCGGGLHIHHIDEDKQNNEDDNLITLCYKHHMFVHKLPDKRLIRHILRELIK